MVNLCSKFECTGCSACMNVCNKGAITMQADEEGFLQPIINPDICVECGLCNRICPVITPVNYMTHKMHSYAAFAKDLSIRQRGSSGGLFSVFAKWIIGQGGYVVGAAFRDEYTVRHIIIDNLHDLFALQGSKYVQSSIGYMMKDIKLKLNNGCKVLFVGTSCQVAGLLNFLRMDYENLYTIDLVCHGVPSPKLFKKYINYLKEKRPNFHSFNFRDLKGWNCNSSSSNSRNPRTGEITTEVLYGYDMAYFALFINSFISRECCYKCQYAHFKHRIGDITLADFWGIGQASPYNYNTAYGVSFVSTNTPKGISLFKEIQEDIEYEERDVRETIELGGNTQLEHPAIRPKERDDIYKNAFNKEWIDFIRSYNLPLKKKTSVKDKVMNKIKRIFHP